MAMKSNMTETKIQKQKASDAVSYKVMAALFLLFFIILGLQKIGDVYDTIGGFEQLYPLTIWGLIGGLAAAVICAALLFILKHSVARLLLPPFAMKAPKWHLYGLLSEEKRTSR